MKENTRKQREELGKKKTGLTAEVNYQEDTLPRHWMDGMTGSLRGNI